jgi:hypothetical protein
VLAARAVTAAPPPPARRQQRHSAECVGSGLTAASLGWVIILAGFWGAGCVLWLHPGLGRVRGALPADRMGASSALSEVAAAAGEEPGSVHVDDHSSWAWAISTSWASMTSETPLFWIVSRQASTLQPNQAGSPHGRPVRTPGTGPARRRGAARVPPQIVDLVEFVGQMIGNEEDFTACLGFEVEHVDENLRADLRVGGRTGARTRRTGSGGQLRAPQGVARDPSATRGILRRPQRRGCVSPLSQPS